MTGKYPAHKLAKCLCSAVVKPASIPKSSEFASQTRLTRTPKTVLFLFAALITLIVSGGCSESPDQTRDQPASQINVYFNNDSLTEGTIACDAVFPVQRSSTSTTNEAAAALEALFLGPTPEELSQGYRSFFSKRTAGLLKRLKIDAGTAYVDLHDRRRELAGVTSSCGSAEFFSQIQRTLGEFPSINRIIFSIEGNPKVFYDWMELECDHTNDNCDTIPFAQP